MVHWRKLSLPSVPRQPHESIPISVLHVLPHIENVGNGLVDVTIDLAISQAGRNHSVAVAGLGGAYGHLLEQAGIAHYPLHVSFAGMRSVVRSLILLRRAVRESGANVIHVHTVAGVILSLFVPRSVARIGTVHNSFGRWAALFTLCQSIIVLNKDDLAKFSCKGLRRRTFIIENGVLGGPRRSLSAVLTAEVTREDSAILFIGGLYTRKGILHLADAYSSLLSRHPNLQLWVCGAGPHESLMRAKLKTASDRVRFFGFVKDTRELMSQCTVFTLPSLAEPFGLVLVEARAAGCAIVASATGGIPSIIEDGHNGLLVEPGRTKALADAIERLLVDKDLRTRVGSQALQGLERYHVRTMEGKVSAVYQRTLRAIQE